MVYLEFSFSVPEDEFVTDMFTSHLGDIGFESFLQEAEVLKAYIQQELLENNSVNEVLKTELFQQVRLIATEILPEKNWNAIWESSYDAVIINEKCRIRAPFHQPDPAFQYDLLIEPRMSFGTAHHETTAQILNLMFKIDFTGKATLDMGCGTAILAILARKLGAFPVVAIDNDEWAYNNSLDNIVLNHTEDILVKMGDAAFLKGLNFDVIIANINRNILLADMKSYCDTLSAGGTLILSGFLEMDFDAISEKAYELGLTYQFHSKNNNWVAAVFTSL